MTLRGTEARTFSAERIDIIDLNITTFNGDATAKVDSILLCRELASFFPNEKIVRGESTVRLMRDDLEITGEQWTYDRQKSFPRPPRSHNLQGAVARHP